MVDNINIEFGEVTNFDVEISDNIPIDINFDSIAYVGGSGGGSGVSEGHVVVVNPYDVVTIGKSYQTYEDAAAYCVSQRAIDGQQWAVKLPSGTYSGNVTVYDGVRVIGNAGTVITGTVDSDLSFTGTEYFSCWIEGCQINSLSLSAGKVLAVYNSVITGCETFEAGILILNYSTVVSSCDYSPLAALQSYNTDYADFAGGTSTFGNANLNNGSVGNVQVSNGGTATFSQVNFGGGNLTIDSGATGYTVNCGNITTLTNNGTYANLGEVYDNTSSGLTATDVQSAIDELSASSGGGSQIVYWGSQDFSSLYTTYSMVTKSTIVLLNSDKTIDTGSYDLSNVKFFGLNSGKPVIDFAPVTLTGLPYELENINMKQGSVTLTGGAFSYTIVLRNSYLGNGDTGTAYMLSDNSFKATLTIYAYENSRIFNDIITMSNDASLVTIYLMGKSCINADAINTTNANYTIYYDESSANGLVSQTTSTSGGVVYTSVGQKPAISSNNLTYDMSVANKNLLVAVDATSSEIRLPPVAECLYDIIKIIDYKGNSGTNNITIVDNTGDSTTIDGASSYVLSSDYACAMLYSDGTEWFVLNKGGSGGSGDVVGPSSAVDGNIVLFDSTTGKLIKDSGSSLSDKQDTLVSATNIKTINSTTLLGSGDLAVQSSDGTQTLTDGATISWDVSDGSCGIVTLEGNRTLSNPTNLQAGRVYRLIVKQDATGSRTLDYGTNYKFPGGVEPVLSSGTSDVDILEFLAETTSSLHLINFISDTQ